MVPKLLFSLACEGFIHYKSATGKSPHTISDYRVTFKKLAEFLKDDPAFAAITRQKLIEFFSSDPSHGIVFHYPPITLPG